MKKYDVHTTLSPRHYALLTKFSEKYETKQKALEEALEALDSRGSGPKADAPPSLEDETWMRMGKEMRNVLVIFQKEIARQLMETADIERFVEYTAREKPVEFAIEWFYRKPMKACTLQEVVDGVVHNIKMQNSSDTISCIDQGDFYTINITHSLGLKSARMLTIMNESAFAGYGVRCESHYSERSIFFKVYKNKPVSA